MTHLHSLVSLAFALSIVLGGCGGAPPSASTTPDSSTRADSALPTVAGAEARALVAQGALLLDVSPAERFEQTRIEGAVNIPWNELEARLAELPSDRTILVYCGSGRASPGATRTLRAHGLDARLVGARANYYLP